MTPARHAMPAGRFRPAALACLVAVATGCSPGPAEVVAAPQATSPACRSALAAAPDTVADLVRTPAPVAGSLSWGEPAIVLRCGLPELAPTTKPCMGIDDVDWILEAEGDPFVFVSYGRAPAVELRVPGSYGRERAVAAATDVGPVARALPGNGRACLGR